MTFETTSTSSIGSRPTVSPPIWLFGEHMTWVPTGKIESATGTAVSQTPSLAEDTGPRTSNGGAQTAAADTKAGGVKPASSEASQVQVEEATLPEPTPRSVTRLDAEAQLLIRTTLAKSLFKSLQSMREHLKEPIAEVYVAQLFCSMRAIDDMLPSDPFTKVIMAAYDAMAFENRWLRYETGQYERLQSLLERLVGQDHIDRRRLGKAILMLEELGFNTTPFGLGASNE